MNQLSQLNPPLFFLIIALAIVDLVFGFGLLFSPESQLTRTNNYIITSLGKEILANLFIFKGVAILIICFRTSSLSTIKWFMGIGMIIWLALSTISLLGISRGYTNGLFGLALFLFMAFLRYYVIWVINRGKRV